MNTEQFDHEPHKTARERELELELKIAQAKAQRTHWWESFDNEWFLLLAFIIVITVIEAIVKITGH